MTTATVELVKPSGEATHRAAARPRIDGGALLAWFVGLWASWPELVAEVRPVIAQMVAYSREGEWSVNLQSASRVLHIGYTALAVLVVALLYVARWTVERPGRFGASVLAVLLAAPAASTLPFVGAFVPDAINPLTWF